MFKIYIASVTYIHTTLIAFMRDQILKHIKEKWSNFKQDNLNQITCLANIMLIALVKYLSYPCVCSVVDTITTK